MTTCIVCSDTLAKRVWPGIDSTQSEQTTPTWTPPLQGQYAQHAYKERCDRRQQTIFVFTVHHHLVMAVTSHSTHTHIHTGHRPVISTAILSQTCLQDEAIPASLKTGELRNFAKVFQPSYNLIQSGRHLFQAWIDLSEPTLKTHTSQRSSSNAFTTLYIDWNRHHLATNMQMELQSVQSVYFQ